MKQSIIIALLAEIFGKKNKLAEASANENLLNLYRARDL